MNTTRILLIGGLFLALAKPALAVPPELTAKFEENRRARALPLYSAPEREIDASAEGAEVEAELVYADDGSVMLAFSLTSEAQSMLLNRGAEVVRSKDQIRNGVIFEGRWMRVYRAVEADTESMQHLVGKRVRATLKQSMMGRHVLVAIRGV
jgi:hypothetical protein